MKRNLLFTSAATAIACLALTTEAQATVPRAFVSTTGSDSNPCSAVQPCRSFNQALTVVESGGEIVVQNSGGYSTGFAITQSVTIDAAGFNASLISTSGTDLCTIDTPLTDRVVLRGISFHGAGVGLNAINVAQVGSLYVEHCSIAEFTGNGINAIGGGNLWVTNTDVRACFHGIDVESALGPGNLVAQESRFTECSDGVLVGNATGLISDCTASFCTDAGYIVVTDSNISGIAAQMSLTNSRSYGNINGIIGRNTNSASVQLFLADCVVTNNTNGIVNSSSGGGVVTIFGSNPGNNKIAENGADGSVTASTTLQ